MQYATENDKIRAEDARKRQENAEEVSAAFSRLSERLDKHSEHAAATHQENEELRAQLAKVNEVLKLSDEIRSKYEAECARLGEEAQAQVAHSSKADNTAWQYTTVLCLSMAS